MKFTGHERDFGKVGQADDLDYTQARYCSPMLGRFLSVDPKELRGASELAQAWNRYSYAWNSPLAGIDPDGREVYVQRHRVAYGSVKFSESHLSLRIEPVDQVTWKNLFSGTNPQTGKGYFTIGAGPSSPAFGNLEAGVNRPTDVDLSTKLESAPVDLRGGDENAVITDLLGYARNLNGNEVDYDTFPAGRDDRRVLKADDSYNSNSFVSGLLYAAGLEPPAIGGEVPGYDRPVPPWKFFSPEQAESAP